ncbi:MAG TPA: ABC-2 family transporter protein [Alphaproteobacteria bacterium]|nr:ABC-2 family transporter protein [Alphaproteobacteria bacterium]
MQIIIFFFLWDAIFITNKEVFGYDKIKIFTYAFVLIIVRAMVFSSRSVDVAGQIANGELTNLILKPINYFWYWITRDFSSKLLNIIFGVFETLILIAILKPNIYFPSNPVYILAFLLSLIIAMFIFFNLSMLTSFVPFWVPELSWGAQFLMIVVIVEFLSGASFPLDIFPNTIYQILRLTPFPYLVFIPIKIYLGNFSYAVVAQSLVIGLIWCVILWKIMNYVWKKGLKIYEGVGR